jgi:hypothetical protein
MRVTPSPVAVLGRVPSATVYTIAAYTPTTDPFASVRPNLSTATPRTNAATATIRPNTVEDA